MLSIPKIKVSIRRNLMVTKTLIQKKIVFVNFSNEWLCFNDYVNSGTKIH